MTPQEPTWIPDGDFGPLKTTHAGHGCYIRPQTETDTGCYWHVGEPTGIPLSGGFVRSVEVAKACALRAAEAWTVIARCADGEPPRRGAELTAPNRMCLPKDRFWREQWLEDLHALGALAGRAFILGLPLPMALPSSADEEATAVVLDSYIEALAAENEARHASDLSGCWTRGEDEAFAEVEGRLVDDYALQAEVERVAALLPDEVTETSQPAAPEEDGS